MTTYKGTVITRFGGHDVPDGFWEKVLAELKPNTFGAAMVKDGAIMSTYIEEKDQKEITLEYLKEIGTMFKDCAVIHHLGNFPAAYSQQDAQPCILIEDDKGDPRLAAFFNGDFHPGIGPRNVAHSDAYIAAHFQVMPKLHQIYRLARGDLNALLEEMKGPVTTQELQALFNGEGIMTFLAGTGEIMPFCSKDDLLKKHVWGWTTNNHGFAEQSYPEQTNKGGFTKPKFKIPGATLTIEKKVEDAPITETAGGIKNALLTATTFTKTEIEGVTTDEHGRTWVQCPQNPDLYGTKAQVGRYYKDFAGYQPEGYKKHPRVLRMEGFTPAIRDFRSLSGVAQVDHAGKIVKINQGVDKTPIKDNAVAAATTEEIDDEGLLNYLTDGKTVALIDKHSQKIVDPEAVRTLEGKDGTFLELAGLNDIQEAMYWPKEVLLGMEENYPGTAVPWGMAWRTLAVELAVKLEKLTGEKATPKEIEKPTETTTTKPKFRIPGRAAG